MIRDNLKINIQTNFFDDQPDYLPPKNQEDDTLSSWLQNAEKASITMFNILDTLRLRRIIKAFNLLQWNQTTIQKYSSRQVFLTHIKKPTKQPQSNQQSRSKHEQTERWSTGVRQGIAAKKNWITHHHQEHVPTQSQSLRESRKRILDHINYSILHDRLHFHSKSIPACEEQRRGVKNPTAKDKDHEINKEVVRNKNTVKDNEKKGKEREKEQEKSINEDSNHITNRIRKLEKLMKDIRREKNVNYPVLVHEKRQVTELPKRRNSHAQINAFMQEISSLRKEVQEIKKINQEILHHSRERSLRSSRSPSPVSARADTGDNHGVPKQWMKLQPQSIKKQQQEQFGEKLRQEQKAYHTAQRKTQYIPHLSARNHTVSNFTHENNYIQQSPDQQKPISAYRNTPWYKEYGSPTSQFYSNAIPQSNQQQQHKQHQHQHQNQQRQHQQQKSERKRISDLSHAKDALSNFNPDGNFNNQANTPASANQHLVLLQQAQPQQQHIQHQHIQQQKHEYIPNTDNQQHHHQQKQQQQQRQNQNQYQKHQHSRNLDNKQHQPLTNSGQLGYTNPDLLRQLKISPFPKHSHSRSPAKLDLDRHPAYTGSPHPNKQQHSRNSSQQEKWHSFKTISDGNDAVDVGSYTYSKGSSVVTSMAKLEQEYDTIMNENNGNPSNHQQEGSPMYQPFAHLIHVESYDQNQYPSADHPSVLLYLQHQKSLFK